MIQNITFFPSGRSVGPEPGRTMFFRIERTGPPDGSPARSDPQFPLSTSLTLHSGLEPLGFCVVTVSVTSSWFRCIPVATKSLPARHANTCHAGAPTGSVPARHANTCHALGHGRWQRRLRRPQALRTIHSDRRLASCSVSATPTAGDSGTVTRDSLFTRGRYAASAFGVLALRHWQAPPAARRPGLRRSESAPQARRPSQSA